MHFKEIGTIGNGAIVVKAGYVGTRRVITLTRAKDGEHVLSMSSRAARNLIHLLREALLELRRMGVE
ncbi:hypothetical protein ES707_06705 [subsurface metagenome]